MLASVKRPIVVRLAVAVVALAAWLGCMPSARAATAQQCIEALASFAETPRPSADDDAPAWLCPLGEPHRVSDDEIPICLIEGASAVAPLPIHSIGDARIEAMSRCAGFDGPTFLAPPDEPQRRLSPDPPSAALLPSLPALEGATERVEVSARTREAGAPRGYRSGVYRPPRG